MAPKLKLTYFNIEGAAEKVRLALKIGGIDFEDERIDFSQWPNLKQKAPFGQLPLLEIDGTTLVAQSYAMLRYVGRLTGLYPEAPLLALRVDEVIGLQEDFSRALMPSIIITRSPQLYGYPADLPEDHRTEIQTRLRAALIAEGGDIPRFLGYFDDILRANGTGYFVGGALTIADCAVFAQLRVLKSGHLDHIPTTIMDGYAHLTKFVDIISSLPAVHAHYLPQ